MSLESIKEQVETGQAIFDELFAMTDKEIAKKLISITDGDHDEILTNKYTCKRYITDGRAEKIEFWYYSGIVVDWSGVKFKPEHGPERTIVRFNKHFKL